MLQPRLRVPLRALEGFFAPSNLQSSTQAAYRTQSRTFQQPLSLNSPSTLFTFSRKQSPAVSRFTQVRYASHATQGSGANKASSNGPGKRLGAKKTGGQYVIPGNIIFRQRGTKWFPGENCGMGRDHTIFSLQTGYVQYYKDPSKHKDRQYIGVVFDKEDKLPLPKTAVTKRRLGMVAVVRNAEDPAAEQGPAPRRRSNYAYAESNYEIGRIIEKANTRVRPYKPNDRWTAWQRKMERIKRVAQMKELKKKKKVQKKVKN